MFNALMWRAAWDRPLGTDVSNYVRGGLLDCVPLFRQGCAWSARLLLTSDGADRLCLQSERVGH